MSNKIIVCFFILFFCASASFAVPNYKEVEPIVVDDSYNVELYHKLYNAWRKKYPEVLIKNTPNEKGYNDTSPMGSFQKEVITPYLLQQKNDSELPQYQYGKRIN